MKRFNTHWCNKCGYEDDVIPNPKDDGLTFIWKALGEAVTWTADNGPICPKCGDGKEKK